LYGVWSSDASTQINPDAVRCLHYICLIYACDFA
jgi:hypothetical protein